MHPYAMQQLIIQRGKDQVINVRLRAALYQTIDRLLRAGLIAVHTVTRTEKRPERTLYALTGTGRTTLLAWMRAMLATPAQEFPEFPAALSYLALLTPDDAQAQLERRLDALTAKLDAIDQELRSAESMIPRLFLIEQEYLRAMLHTEIAWVRDLLADLAAGHLTWSEEWIRAVAAQFDQGESGQHE
jgi:DNA-binding PadR family transcriptional regulator